MWHQLDRPADPDDVARVLAACGAADPRCGDVTVVAIDGPSGSGKTTLAKGVSDGLGAPVVHMDLVFPGWDGLAEAVHLLVDQVLLPLSQGRDGRHRLWDWERDEWGGWRDVPWTPLLVVEGCGSSVGRAGELAAVKVWLEADQAERYRRGIRRDGEGYAPHWRRWQRQEDALYAADGTRAKADIRLLTD